MRALLLVLLVALPATAAERPAVVDVSGYGVWGNLKLKRTLRLLQTGKTPPPIFDANFVEDAALMLLSALTRDGYLEPRISARLTLADGQVVTYAFDAEFETVLPRPLAVKRAQFRVRRGVLYHYRQVRLAGLETFKEAEAKRYFVEPEFLIALKRSRIYTPARQASSVANLTEAYARRGFHEAKIEVRSFEREDRTGAVRLEIEVEEGLPWFVRSVRTEVFAPGKHEVVEERVGKPYSRFWEQDFAQRLKVTQYRQGFPDATVTMTITNREVGETSVQLDLHARVETGPLVRVGEVTFTGQQRTRLPVLDSRVKLEPGDKLDRLQAEGDRLRLARLGVFETVELRYENVDEHTRNIVYSLEEGKTIEFSLLFGYGSYELLRGGFELSQYNLFGLAHHARLRLTQSFKSSSGQYLYNVPTTVFGADVNLFAEVSGLRREEISFDREEYGGSIGGQRHIEWLDSDVSLRYIFQSLNAGNTQTNLPPGVERALVGAVALDLRHDHRDNPLVPRRGYNLFANLELASTTLGGETEYQRLQVNGSVHHGLGGGRYLHVGLSHGAVPTWGGTRDHLPFNRRFFPGGENSVRGFQQGEAAPRDDRGRIIGAETFLQGNLELEQYLTPTWSLVAFVDAVGFAERISDYPFDEVLSSAGGGVRWRTIIGPVRLEYGHNLRRRSRDPAGTLHVSVGFPF